MAEERIILQVFDRYTPQNLYSRLLPQLEDFKRAGFTTLYLPPPYKGYSGLKSRGYDIYDHYDLGEFYQQGSSRGYYGSRAELDELITNAQALGLELITDLILTKELEQSKTGRLYEEDHSTKVADNFKEWIQWLSEEVGFAGFKIRYPEGISNNILAGADQLLRDSFCVIDIWSGQAKYVEDKINSLGSRYYALDLPLFYQLKQLATNPDYDLNYFASEALFKIKEDRAVTFVENQDTQSFYPHNNNKDLAYAYILFNPGIPSILYSDYLQLEEEIKELIALRRGFLTDTAPAQEVYVDRDLYVIKRQDIALILNNSQEQLIYDFHQKIESLAGLSDSYISQKYTGRLIMKPWSYMIVKI